MKSILWRSPRVAACAIVALAFAAGSVLVAAGARAAETGADAIVSGHVAASDGTPISGALVDVRGNDETQYHATSDRSGAFRIARVPGGTYAIAVSARGYAPVENRTIDVAAHGETHLDLILGRATTGSLATIGVVRAAGGMDSVSHATSPRAIVNAQAAAAAGVTTVGDMLWSVPSLTPTLPLGGGGNAPVAFAIRGPDPTETLVDVDGHQVNNGGTGTFDLSQLDPADLQDVQVVYGISPSSLIGPDTLGGALNVVTLEPTTTPHALARGFGGSFDSFGATVQSTGTVDRLGYALSLHRATSAGQVNQTVVDGASGETANAGSAFDGSTLLAKLRYQIGGGYVQASVRDQTVYKDLTALLTSYPAPFSGPPGGGDALVVKPQLGPVVQTFPNTTLGGHNAGYGLDAFFPLGSPDASGLSKTTLQFSHLTSLASQSVAGAGADTSPYLYNDRDLIGDDWLQIDRRIGNGTLSLKADVLTESLRTDFVAGQASDDAVTKNARAFEGSAPATPPPSLVLDQTQRFAVLRYEGDATERVHYAVATYFSGYSTWGSSFDPRAGVSWTPTASTVVRATVGTTFQTPQLSSLFVPPVLPPPVNGLVSIGNPNLKPDRATEYDLGFDHLFGRAGRQTHVAVDFYETNLRDAIQQYVPAQYDPTCTKRCPTTYPVNFGDQRYRGFDVELHQQLGGGLDAYATWEVNSSFLLQTLPGSALVAGQQSLGQPLHKWTLGFDRNPDRGAVYGAGLTWMGTYNPLNRSPFATLDAKLAYRWNGWEAGLYGTNLTGAYDDRFTTAGGGIPYEAAGGTLVPTDAYVLQGAKVLFVVTRRI